MTVADGGSGAHIAIGHGFYRSRQAMGTAELSNAYQSYHMVSLTSK